MHSQKLAKAGESIEKHSDYQKAFHPANKGNVLGESAGDRPDDVRPKSG